MLEKLTARRELFIIVLAAAVLCIGTGVYNVWKSFERFDSSILAEKDNQFYSLMRSDDINIENSLDSFVREAETFFARVRVQQAVDSADASGDVSVLRPVIDENTLKANPVYADLVLIRNDKVAASAGGGSYTFITDKDTNGMRLCRDDKNEYYVAYEYDASDSISFEALIDLRKLYNNSVSGNQNRQVILLDNTAFIMLLPGEEGVTAHAAPEPLEGQIEACREHMINCQQEDSSEAVSIDFNDEDGRPYTARMLVMPSSNTVNGEFAIGIIANYEEAIAASRDAAGGILIYGGLMMVGVLGLIFMLLLMNRANDESSAELQILKKKNETMEEINQKMQALSHHQRLETIGTMTASIAHDFNNLLTPIMGYSIMTMEMLPADATDLQENLMEVYNASVKAKDIVTRLADLTKKGNEQNFKELGVDEAIRSALKVTLPAKPDEVEVKAGFRAEDVKIRADRTQISQLVMNIVLNSYDAMRGKGGTLIVSTRQSGDEVIIKFKDTGCGMDAETVSRVFDPFYTTKESGKGTGLGLAIVAQIVETHGGRIYVESEPGTGTEFRIYLPCAGTGIETLTWGPDGEGKFDTKRYDAGTFRRELARAENKDGQRQTDINN